MSAAVSLAAEGFEVETYNDGQAALDAFNKKLPDMAVLDIKMPRMDGMDLLQRLRQKTAMPVIFLTSKDDEIDEVLGLRMGADDYVKKPFSQRLLVERIRALLRRFADGPAAPRGKLERQGRVLDRHGIPAAAGFGPTTRLCEITRPADGCCLRRSGLCG